MSVSWFKNLVGFNLDEEAMKDIPNPTAELVTHVVIKDIQAFSLIGTLIVGPISALRKRETRNLVGIRRRMTRCGLWGFALGIVAGPVMTYGLLAAKRADEASIYDRCYRLRNNRGQVRVDRGSMMGLVGGAGLSIALKRCPMFGGLVGMCAGVIGAAYCNVVIDKSKKGEESKNKKAEENKSKKPEESKEDV